MKIIERLKVACLAFRIALALPPGAPERVQEARPAARMEGRPEHLMVPVVAPAYESGNPNTCPGCWDALDSIQNGAHNAMCVDPRCGQWWTTKQYRGPRTFDTFYTNPNTQH